MKKKNVLFCIVQSGDSEEWLINHPLYDLQEALMSSSDKIYKAFVYGNKRVYTCPFGTVDTDKIYYADSAAQDVSVLRLMIIADTMMKQQMEKEPEKDHIMVVLSDREKDLIRVDMDRIKAFFKTDLPKYKIIFLRKETYKTQDNFEVFISGLEGECFTYDELDKVIGILKG